MLPDFAKGEPGWEAIFGAAIFGASLVVAFIVWFIFNKVLAQLMARTGNTLDDRIIKAVGGPLFIFVLVFGPYTALSATTYLDDYQDQLDRGLISAEILIVCYGIKRVVGALLTWYGAEMAHKTTTSWDERVLPIAKRFVDLSIISVAVLLVLQAQGLNISPLLAGLGIGGLAVALAVQPTLSNLFAGTYTVTESRIGAGDYIEMDGGPSGWVEEVGWRTTKIRDFFNNLIIIPNSHLADSIVTNVQGPDPAVMSRVECGVSYESDLDQVAEVAIEVTNKVLQENPEAADLEYEPIVRMREFGDSNINFIVIFRARNFIGQFLLKDQLIRRIHKRFTKEGIEINYPVRKVVYPSDGASPDPFRPASEAEPTRTDGQN